MYTTDTLDRFLQRQYQAVLEHKEFVKRSAIEGLLRIYAEETKKVGGKCQKHQPGKHINGLCTKDTELVGRW